MNATKDYRGKFRGQVVSVEDPEKRCRVKVNVFDVTDGVPVSSLPWAMTVLPLGTRKGEGGGVPLRNGDLVWIEFQNGDTRRPVVVGALMEYPKGDTSTSANMKAGEGAFVPERGDGMPAANPPKYYADTVFQQNGCMAQMCNDGTLRVSQIKAGSYVEITPSGDMILYCKGTLHIHADGDVKETVNGNVTRTVNGNFTRTVKGELVEDAAKGAAYGSSKGPLSFEAATTGRMKGPGGLTFTGPTEFEGNVHGDGDIIAAGANSNHHSH